MRAKFASYSAVLKVQNLFRARSARESYKYVLETQEIARAAERAWLKECRERGMDIVEMGAIMELNHTTVYRRLQKLGIK